MRTETRFIRSQVAMRIRLFVRTFKEDIRLQILESGEIGMCFGRQCEFGHIRGRIIVKFEYLAYVSCAYVAVRVGKNSSVKYANELSLHLWSRCCIHEIYCDPEHQSEASS